LGPAGDTGDEVRSLAHHSTPPGHEARAKARQTASELGARGPPVARKKSSKKASPGGAGALGEDDVLKEASAIMRASGGSSGALTFEREPTDEELMAEILEATK